MDLKKKACDLRIPFVWKDRQPILLDRFLYVPSFYERHEEWTPLPWSDMQIFGNDHPVHLEYCSGNGQWICERAVQNPHLNWVAVEKRFDRARQIWVRLHQRGISNLYVICGDALSVTRHYLPLSSLAEIFVNFPDPWPKLRHAKHRLIQSPFLHEVENVLVSNGRATFVTDEPFYAAQMVRELTMRPNWSSLLPPPYYSLDWPDYGNSFFSDLWKQKGKKIYFLSFGVSM